MVTALSPRARRARALRRHRSTTQPRVAEHGVAHLLELAAANARPFALERGVSIVVERDGVGDESTVPCDRETVLRKLASMLELATRGAPHGGVVEASCTLDDTCVCYDVSHPTEPRQALMTLRLPRTNMLTK